MYRYLKLVLSLILTISLTACFGTLNYTHPTATNNNHSVDNGGENSNNNNNNDNDSEEPSTDASLSNLVVSPVISADIFNPETLEFAATTGSETVTITPTASNNNATITVDGTAVSSGSDSDQISLELGLTTIDVVVTAEDGATQRTYSVLVTRNSSNANLSDLIPSDGMLGMLNPSFDPSIFSYTLTTAADSIAFMPISQDEEATITIEGSEVGSSVYSQLIPLNVGENTINIVVWAADAQTYNEYVVLVTKLNNESTLSDLYTSSGTWENGFTPSTLEYNISTTEETISVSPYANGSGSTITLNDLPIDSGSTSEPISLNRGSNTISIIVTAEDGITNTTYTLHVTRIDTRALLSEIYSGDISLDPAFDPAIFTYSATTAMEQIALWITPEGEGTSITINGDPFAVSPTNIPLVVGQNDISIVVTAQDGMTQAAYTITIFRLSTDSLLSNISLEPTDGIFPPHSLTLDQSFSPEIQSYYATLNYGPDLCGPTGATIVATAQDTNATVNIQNGAVTGTGSASYAFDGEIGGVTILVTAEDGVTTTEYVVYVSVLGYCH